MARRVEWTETALEDVDQVAAYIARDSARYAAALVHEALSTASGLGVMPERGRIVPELDRPDVRQLLIYGYRLVYQVTDESVVILGLIHGARDLQSLWQRELRPSSELENI